MATNNNKSQKYLAEIQKLENFADRKKLVIEWLGGDEEYYDALADYFESLFVKENGKAIAMLAYFRELYGVDTEVQPVKKGGVSEAFVLETLAAKDRQIAELLSIVERLTAK